VKPFARTHRPRVSPRQLNASTAGRVIVDMTISRSIDVAPLDAGRFFH
jgi:hypothetical protein